MDPIVICSPSGTAALPDLHAALTDARDFLRQRLRGAGEEVLWTVRENPPDGLAQSAAAEFVDIDTRRRLLDGIVVGLELADRAGYRDVSSFNLMAHQPRASGGGGNHLVVHRRGSELRIEVSPYAGETLVRSEIERLLRRLDVPRSNEEAAWPTARLGVVVPRVVGDAMLAKSRPRRCAYWMLGGDADLTVLEILPVSNCHAESGGVVTPASALDGEPELRDRLVALGAEVGSADGRPTISWRSEAAEEAAVALCGQHLSGHSTPSDWSDASGWEAYWRFRALLPSVVQDLLPATEAVFLRYLLTQTRPDIANRMARVLCVGNGASLLPHILALAGLSVSVLELSPTANEISRSISPTASQLRAALKLAVGHDEAESYEEFLRPDGSCVWVEGNFFDPSVCRGPYEVIVLTRVLEGLSDFDIQVAVSRLEPRLSADGWCWVVVQNSGFKWITVQRAFQAAGFAVVPYDDLPGSGRAMSGGLTSG